MAEPNDAGISVNVPGSDDEDYEDSVDLALEQEQDGGDEGLALQMDEDDERNKYGLNSPKRDEESVTPATKFRAQAGINSPKQQKKMDWGNAGEDKLAGLVTQVNRDGVQQTGFDDDEPEQKQAPTQQATQQEPQPSGGMCACLSSLFTCCSNSSTQTQTATQVSHNQQKRTDGEPKATKQRPPDTDKTELLDAGEQAIDDHESESSTEYIGSLLPPLLPEDNGKKCLVLDLDETLVHSSFKPISTADFIIPVEIDNVVHRVYVMKRPFVDEFLIECAKHYEVVIFTASLSKYADPLLDQLDPHKTIRHRLFRESCVLHAQAYVKDLRRMGRKLKDTIIVDNSPQSYLFQPKNAVPIASWFDDKTDTQLRDFIPVLETTLKQIRDVRWILNASEKSFRWLCSQANQDLGKYRPKQ